MCDVLELLGHLRQYSGLSVKPGIDLRSYGTELGLGVLLNSAQRLVEQLVGFVALSLETLIRFGAVGTTG
jgi:hypothetical protein